MRLTLYRLSYVPVQRKGEEKERYYSKERSNIRKKKGKKVGTVSIELTTFRL